jgi:hypothetical protein
MRGVALSVIGRATDVGQGANAGNLSARKRWRICFCWEGSYAASIRSCFVVSSASTSAGRDRTGGTNCKAIEPVVLPRDGVTDELLEKYRLRK